MRDEEKLRADDREVEVKPGDADPWGKGCVCEGAGDSRLSLLCSPKRSWLF